MRTGSPVPAALGPLTELREEVPSVARLQGEEVACLGLRRQSSGGGGGGTVLSFPSEPGLAQPVTEVAGVRTVGGAGGRPTPSRSERDLILKISPN